LADPEVKTLRIGLGNVAGSIRYQKNWHRKIIIEGGTLMGNLLAEGIPVDLTHQQ